MINYQAIILCAEQEVNTPVSGLKANEISILQYIISALKYHNIKNITVMVDDYNFDYFFDLINDEEVFIQSILSDSKSSLYTVCSFNNDNDCSLLIIDGNIFFDRKAIKSIISINKDNVGIVSNSRYLNSTQAVLKDDVIIDFIDGNSENKEILGIFKITNKLFEDLKKISNKENESFYSSILKTDNKLYGLYIDDFVWYEVFDKSSIVELESEYIPRVFRVYDSELYMDKIHEIFNLKLNISISNIESLGGMTNKNFLINTVENHKFVIRIPGSEVQGLIDRNVEKRNTFISVNQGVDVKPIYFCGDTGIKITPYIRNAETLNPQTIKKNIIQCTDVLKGLHCSNINFKNSFSISDEIEKYLSRVIDLNFYEGLIGYKIKVDNIIEKYNQLDFKLCSCHNDTVAENFIKSRDKIYIIDWEYSSLNDPLWDLSAMFLENNFSQSDIKKSLNRYFKRELTDSEKFRLQCCYIFQDLLWTIWSILKCESHNDYYEYGLVRFNRLKYNFGYDNEESKLRTI